MPEPGKPFTTEFDSIQDHFQIVAESVSDAIITIDEGSRILFANPAVEQVFGYQPSELIGRQITILMPEGLRLKHLHSLRSYIHTGMKHISWKSTDFPGLHKNSKLLSLEISFGETRIDGKCTFTGVIRDVTERKNQEHILQASEKRFRAMIEHSSDGIALIRQDGIVFYVSPSTERILGYSPEELAGRNVFELMHPDDVARIQDLFAELLKRPGASITVEFRHQHKNGSWMWIEGSGTNLLEEPGIRGIVANYRDISERKQTEKLLRHQNEYLSALHEISLGLIGRLDLDELLGAIVTRASDLMGIPNGFLLLLEPDAKEMRVRVATGFAAQFTEMRVRPGEGVSGKVWQSGRPLAVNDYNIWPGRLVDPRYDVLRSIVAVPLESNSEVIGVFGVESTEERTEFDERHIEILMRFAQLASIAVTNARLYDAAKKELTERKRAEERIQILHEMERNILRGRSPESIAETALESVHRLIPFATGCVTTFDLGTNEVRVLAIAGHLEESLHTEIKNFMMFWNSGHSPLPKKSQIDGSVSYMNVPLVFHEELIGLMTLTAAGSETFGSETGEIAAEVANELAIAIQQARLHEQIRLSGEQLKGLSHRLIRAQESERRRIARELHDEIGQALSLLRLQMGSLRTSGLHPQKMEESIVLVDRAIHQLRNLSLDLRPSLLDDLGLVPAVRWFLDRHSRETEQPLFEFVSEIQEKRFASEVETACFRIVQEATTNVIRHANAKNVRVALREEDGHLLLKIRDDGIGFDVQNAKKRATSGESLGLLGMAERVVLVGGEIEFVSTPGKGAEVSARFPL